MKIKNNTVANLSVGSLSTRGKAHKNYMVVPGEATLELDDQLWLTEYAEPAAKIIEAGNLEIVEAPALTDEQKAEAKAKAIEDAKALLAETEQEEKEAAKETPKTAPKK